MSNNPEPGLVHDDATPSHAQPPPRLGDQLTQIMASVEHQFAELRTLQEQQDEHASTIEQQQHALNEREQTLARRAEEIDAALNQVNQERESVAEQRDRFNNELHDARDELNTLQSQLTLDRQAFDEQKVECDRTAGELAERRTELDRQWDDFNAQRTELDEQRQVVDAELSGIEQRETQLVEQRDDWRRQCEEHATHVEQVEHAHTEREQWFARQQEELAGREQSLSTEAEQCDQRGDELRQRQEELQQQHTQLEEQRAALEAQRLELDGHRSELEQKSAELDQQREQLDQRAHAAQIEADELREHVQCAKVREEETGREVEALLQQLAAASEQIDQHHQAAAAAQEWINQLKQQAEEAQSSITLANERADAAHAEASELLELAERERDEAKADADALQTKIEDLMAQIAERARTLEELELANAEKARFLAERDQSIAQLRQKLMAIEDAASPAPPTPADPDPELHARIDDLQQQLDAQLEARQRIEDAFAALRDERDALHTQLESAPTDDPEQQQRIEELQQQLAQHQSTLHQAEDAFATLRDERDTLYAQLEEATQPTPGSDSAEPDPEHQQRIEHLEAQLEATGAEQRTLEEAHVTLQHEYAELQRQIESADDDRSVDEIAHELQQRDADLCAKAKRIAEVAEHLYRRQRRLKSLLRAHRQRTRMNASAGTPSASTPASMEEHARNVRRIDRARQELTEVRDALAAAERKMMRRWAVPRAIFVMVWIVILLAASGVASWFAADHYFPAVVSASVTFEAKSKQIGSISEEETQRWSAWHLEYIASDPFRTTLAQRYKERRNDILNAPGAVHSRLERDMTVDSSRPEAITITLAGTNGDEVTTTLDVLATTLMTESTKRLRHRTDGTWAVAKERTDAVTGVKQFATLNTVAVEDQRLHYAGVMFGGVFASLALIVGVIVFRLLKVKREFDADGTLFVENVQANSTGQTSI